MSEYKVKSKINGAGAVSHKYFKDGKESKELKYSGLLEIAKFHKQNLKVYSNKSELETILKLK